MKLGDQANAKSSYKYNISVGNPDFLHEYWMHPVRRELLRQSALYSITSESLSYNFSPGRNELLGLLRQLHLREHNMLDVKDRYIVMGNGATQVINALMMVYRDRGLTGVNVGDTSFYAVFKPMAESAGLDFHTEDADVPNSFDLITCPNNPDGALQTPKPGCILDLSYLWKTYFRDNDTMPVGIVNNPDSPLVFSLTKAFGMASSRIGWLVTKDAQLAKDVEDKIELLTGQISYEAQQKAIAVVSYELKQPPENSLFTFGQRELERRWKIVEKNTRLTFNTTSHSKRGMFLLIREQGSDIQYLLNARGISGDNFGMYDIDTRFNLGCSTEEFEAIFNDPRCQRE